MTPQVDFGDGHTWHKTTRSGDNGGNCVSVARCGQTGMIGVRDSKLGPAGRPHWYSRPAWNSFLAGVKAGDFDTA